MIDFDHEMLNTGQVLLVFFFNWGKKFIFWGSVDRKKIWFKLPSNSHLTYHRANQCVLPACGHSFNLLSNTLFRRPWPCRKSWKIIFENFCWRHFAVFASKPIRTLNRPIQVLIEHKTKTLPVILHAVDFLYLFKVFFALVQISVTLQ